MDLEGVMRSELSQAEKDKWNLKNKRTEFPEGRDAVGWDG